MLCLEIQSLSSSFEQADWILSSIELDTAVVIVTGVFDLIIYQHS